MGMKLSDVARVFVEKSAGLLRKDYLPKIERCLEKLGPEDIWWRPGEASNSIGNLMLHLSGNVRQWIVGGVGRRAHDRRRQQEFDDRGPIPGSELLEQLRSILDEAEAIIVDQTSESLTSRRQIQGYDVTVLEAIYHVVEHFGMHTGQIITLTKLRRDEDLGLWTAPERTRS